MKTPYRIKAFLIQHMAQSEISAMIPPDAIEKIRQYDDHPEFRVFAIGHEGDVHGNIIGRGKSAVRYLKDVILQMFDKLPFGLPAFLGHAHGTNDHSGRIQVGEVVGKTVKNIGGKLHTLAAVYINKESRDKNLDVASIEANFEGIEGDRGLEVVKIDNLTGLALGNSALDKPGFPGATLLGALQAFSESKGNEKMTKEEIKKAIEEGNYSPEDFFSSESIVASEPSQKAMQQKHEHARRVEKKLSESEELRIKAENERETLKVQLKDKTSQINQSKTSTILDGLSKERKLTDKFKTYLNKNIKNFKSEAENEDGIKADLNKFIDEYGDQFEKDGKEFGFDAKISEETKKEGEEQKKGVGPADRQGSEDEEGGEYENPKENDLIPQGAAS